MAGLRTEFPFTLPKGLVDADGRVHQEGIMRLATARDELEPLNDPKVRDADDPYLTVIVLSRVITRLGTLNRLSPRDVEGLFAADLAYLQDVYAAINFGTEQEIERVLAGPATPPPRPAATSTGALANERASSVAGTTPAATRPPAPAPAPAPRPEPESGSEPDGPRIGEDGMELPTPRRARIEEVGRSSGRPDRL